MSVFDLDYMDLAASMYITDVWIGNAMREEEIDYIKELKLDYLPEFIVGLYLLNKDERFKKLDVVKKSKILADVACRFRGDFEDEHRGKLM